jgi:hypothetical protein
MSPEDSLARQRFLTMQLIRLAGVIMMFLGFAVIAGKIDWNKWVGCFLVLNGAFDALLLPPLLARRWRSPRQ